MNKVNISKNELNRSLNFIILGVTFGMAFFTVVGNPVGGAPFTGFTRALGVSDFLYGIIMALPILGGIVQVIASFFLETFGHRKRIFFIFGLFHRLVWIPIVIIPLVIKVDQNIIRIWSITLLITLSAIANSVTTICFLSWMGNLIPVDIRGKFFTKRTTIYTISAALTSIIVGLYLDAHPGFNGYTVVFIIVAILGALDIVCFIWVKDPPMNLPEEKTSFKKLFSEPFKNKNYLRYIAFSTIWNFGINFAGPFFNVYMLENLKMGYFAIALFTQFSANISTIIFFRLWGKVIDKYGSKPVLTLCCSVVTIFPILWFFATPQNYYILIIMNLITGIVWPGVELTSTNLSIWLAPEKNRSIYIAVFTLITSTFGIALAFILAGAFMQSTGSIIATLNIPFFLGQKLNNFHLLFFSSSIIRLLSVRLLLPRVNEENSKKAVDIINDTIKIIKFNLRKVN